MSLDYLVDSSGVGKSCSSCKTAFGFLLGYKSYCDVALWLVHSASFGVFHGSETVPAYGFSRRIIGVNTGIPGYSHMVLSSLGQ